MSPFLISVVLIGFDPENLTVGAVGSLGSILAFFLFNGGIIALVHPLEVEAQVLRFYLPFCFATVVIVSLLMMTKNVPRWAGGLLVLLYGVFVLKGYGG